MTKASRQNGFSPIEAMLVLFVVGLIAGIGWFVYQNRANSQTTKPSSKQPSISSYDECVKAGNPVQESYPEVCTTQDGKHFTNPKQTANPQPAQDLAIKEWGVRLTLSDEIIDAYYKYTSATAPIVLSTNRLDALSKEIQGCKSGLGPLLVVRAKNGDYKDTNQPWSAEELNSGVKVGDYYYLEKHLIEPACAVATSDAGTQIAGIKKSLRQALKEVKAL